MRFLDSVVSGALILLVCFTALAFGSVYPWAFKTMEVAAFVLMVLWLALMPLRGGDDGRPLRAAAIFAIPVCLFLGFCAAQLIRLPPNLLASGSRGAFSLYERVLPGWPQRAPYADIPVVETAAPPPRVYILPSEQDVERGALIPFAASNEAAAPAASAADLNKLAAERDRLPRYGVSVSPPLSRSALIEGCAYAAVFLLVIGYPLGEPERERRFIQVMMASILAFGLLIALLGLANWATWNGKILWILTPSDWASGGQVLLRACGPFVNPDDFANYLAILLPLALAGTFYNVPLRYTPRITGFKLVSASGLFVITMAILLSLSRGGWAASAAGIAAFFILAAVPLPAAHQETPAHHGAPPPSPFLRWRWRPLTVGLTMVVGATALAAVILGPTIAHHAAARLEGTVSTNAEFGLVGRLSIWQGTIAMIREYPLLGVGLGAWPVAFPHYRVPPWFPLTYREAHNDYLQLLAETGVVGVLLLVALFATILAILFRARRRLGIEDWLLLVPLMAAIPAMAVHEIFEFCLRIPANALLFTVLVALAVRIALRGRERRGSVPTAIKVILAIAATGGAAFFTMLAIHDPAPNYPFDLTVPETGTQALADVFEHPARSETHMELPRFIPESAGFAPLLQEFRTAVWLDPVNPGPRDRYIQELFAAGQADEALRQITISIYNAPANRMHFYLADRYVPFLSDAVEHAVEDGYRQLLAKGDPGGLDGLSNLYLAQGRFDDQARLLADYIHKYGGEKPDYGLLIGAANAYVHAGQNAQAETYFKQAIEDYPYSIGPYQSLITDVYAPARNVDAAKALVEEGVNNGIDPTPLYLSLLSMAQAAADKPLIETCLRKLLASQPSSNLVIQLGKFYLDNNQPDQAAAMFRRATDMNPQAADAYFLLGQAEEADYRYTAADDAYSRAISLAPDNTSYRQVYQSFRDKMKRDSSTQ